MSVNIQYPDVKAGKKMIRVAWARSDQDMRGVAPNRKYFGTARAREARQFAAEKAVGFGSGACPGHTVMQVVTGEGPA